MGLLFDLERKNRLAILDTQLVLFSRDDWGFIRLGASRRPFDGAGDPPAPPLKASPLQDASMTVAIGCPERQSEFTGCLSESGTGWPISIPESSCLCPDPGAQSFHLCPVKPKLIPGLFWTIALQAQPQKGSLPMGERLEQLGLHEIGYHIVLDR